MREVDRQDGLLSGSKGEVLSYTARLSPLGKSPSDAPCLSPWFDLLRFNVNRRARAIVRHLRLRRRKRGEAVHQHRQRQDLQADGCAADLDAAGIAHAAVEQRASVSPANFPRVDGDTQRTRDQDRRRILEDELKGEEERLAKLKSEFNNGEPERRGDERNFALYKERTQRLQEDIARTENNVRALAREMSLLKTQ